ELRPIWHDNEDWKSNLAPLEAHFRVSKWVIARRALTLGFVSLDQYRNFVAEQTALWRQREKANGAPSYFKLRNAQISTNFSKAILSQAFNGHLLLREAGQLLGVKPASIQKFANEVSP
ncbi:MAG: hypothetical protein Q7I91_02205, partial [Moraxellaceae bacterium]|nr:hypothetical protein [Moraxellaceae bacterium]